jgi:hypothetical protein
MKIAPADAYVLAKLLVGHEMNGHLDSMAPPYQNMAEYLGGLSVERRLAAWEAMLAARPERDDLIVAVADQKPDEPLPEAPASVRYYATLADVAEIVAAQQWLWRGWIASGVLNSLASDPGVGKTRFALDLARRLWHRLPLPDGQANDQPLETRTLWVQGDRNWAELLQCARDFDLPDEAVVLGSSPDDPFGSLDLDDPATLAALGDRIEAAGTPLVIIDTVGMVTSRNLSRPEEAREFFAPILELCQHTGVAILGLTHLSANREALGRRIVEKARVVIKMTQPDPEGERDRRRLWVDKTAVMKPPALGVTMGDAGNDYDFNPPKEPDPPARGRPPAKLEECKAWLKKQLTPTPVRVVDIRRDAEQVPFATDTLYRAKDALGVDEYILERRKWWKLPTGS